MEPKLTAPSTPSPSTEHTSLRHLLDRTLTRRLWLQRASQALVTIVGATALSALDGQAAGSQAHVPQGRPSTRATLQEIFADSFESESNWLIFEELVGPCYASGIGAVERTNAVACDGQWSLLVEANRPLSSTASNHVIGHKNIGIRPLGNGIHQYEVCAMIDTASAGKGQTGPEISSQRTDADGLTSTAGIQAVVNPFVTGGQSWNIWRETSPGSGVATWQQFMTQALQVGQFYTLVLEFDYLTNQYRRFEITGPGVSRSVGLSGIRIARENKGFSAAHHLTVESENLDSNCGAAGHFTYKMYYDRVRLLQEVEGPVPTATFTPTGVPTLLSTPTPTVTPTPTTPPIGVCSPRPGVSVVTRRDGSGQILATVTSTSSAAVPVNRLLALELTSLTNAVVVLDEQQYQAPTTVSLASLPTTVSFTVRRVVAGQPATVALTVHDQCLPAWKTLVGMGQSVP